MFEAEKILWKGLLDLRKYMKALLIYHLNQLKVIKECLRQFILKQVQNRTLKNHPKDIDFEDFKSTPIRKSSYARRSANMKLKHNYLENPFKSSDTIDDYRYNIKGDMQVLESIMVCNQIYIF